MKSVKKEPLIMEYTQEALQTFKEAILPYKERADGLLPVVHIAQEQFRCVPVAAQKVIAEVMNVSVARVSGIVTFYDYFTMTPLGKNVVEVCVGTSCYMQESKHLLAVASEVLQVAPGETRADGEVTLRIGRCFGRCEHSPNVEINHTMHLHVSEQELRQYLNNLEDHS
jgi:NADH:ubiquinone oxidoreductase subunit E